MSIDYKAGARLWATIIIAQCKIWAPPTVLSAYIEKEELKSLTPSGQHEDLQDTTSFKKREIIATAITLVVYLNA